MMMSSALLMGEAFHENAAIECEGAAEGCGGEDGGGWEVSVLVTDRPILSLDRPLLRFGINISFVSKSKRHERSCSTCPSRPIDPFRPGLAATPLLPRHAAR